MKERCSAVLKVILFLTLLLCSIHVVDKMVVAKYELDDTEPHTETYKGFYNMQRNTVDVLFLGTSHAASAFNPQDFYDYAGICSYNLSSSAQAVYNSYFWLKEALNYQHPKVVILDCNYLFSNYVNEGASRRTLDFMRPGPVKFEAAKANIRYDVNNHGTVLSYFIPFLRYHSRWTSLTEGDFYQTGTDSPPNLKGFWFYNEISGVEGFAPHSDNIDTKEVEDFSPLSEEYLNKIVQLCGDNDITLILVKTPFPAFTVERHNKTEAFAAANGIPCYDFNMENLFHQANLDYRLDTYNLSENKCHLNLQGARKISYFMAEELIKNKWVHSVKDMQWEASREFNNNAYNDFLLHNEHSLDNYLSMIDDAHYTVFIAAKDDAATSLSQHTRDGLRHLGLRADWTDGFQKSYIAVLEHGNVTFEKMSSDSLTYENSFRKGLSRIKINSAGYQCGNTCSIQINESEQIKNKSRGIHFVVYSNDRNCVVDSVGFDTSIPDAPASR